MNISFFLKPKVEVSYLTESCPVQKAIDDGYDRIVLVLTRPKDVLREQKRDIAPARILRHSYPAAAERLLNRYATYNDEVALAKEDERDGRVRPMTCAGFRR